MRGSCAGYEDEAINVDAAAWRIRGSARVADRVSMLRTRTRRQWRDDPQEWIFLTTHCIVYGVCQHTHVLNPIVTTLDDHP